MRLIDANDFIAFLQRGADCEWNKKTAPSSWSLAFLTFIEDVEQSPTIDAVPVVRCKDCTYCSHFTDGHLECRLLYNLKPFPTTYCHMEENDFCSYGVRKDEQTL